MKQYIYNVFVGVDQLANALAGGNPDGTVSARCGYNSKHRGGRYWPTLEAIIDYTFLPLDGPGHCWQAWEGDNEDRYYDAHLPLRLLLAGMVGVSCPPLALIARATKLLLLRDKAPPVA